MTFANDVIEHLLGKGIKAGVHVDKFGYYNTKKALVLSLANGEQYLQIMEYDISTGCRYRLSWMFPYHDAKPLFDCALDDEIEFDADDKACNQFRKQCTSISVDKFHTLFRISDLTGKAIENSFPHIVIGKADKVNIEWATNSIDGFLGCANRNEFNPSEVIKDTDATQLIKARRGQGEFKTNVNDVEKKGCRITGLTIDRHLRASHIKPWSVCDNTERLDGNNGLLLSPHVDHLFDQGYISFKDNGDILICDCLDRSVLQSWGITKSNAGAFNNRQKNYLKYHRKYVFGKRCNS